MGLSIDDANNLHIGTIEGDIIDYAPVVTSGGAEIPSSFLKSGKDEITFKIENPTPGKELVIDPWTVFPISPATYACDISIDKANNTYVLEYSVPVNLLMYVQKYNALGVLQWTYTLNEYTANPFNPLEVDSANVASFMALSDFVTDENGNSYIAAPGGWANLSSNFAYGMLSLNTLGARNYLDYTYANDSIYETWNVAYSCADSVLVEASCYVCCDIAQFDGVNIATGNPDPGEYVNDNIGELYAGTIAPNGNYYALSATNNSFGPDQLICCKVTKTSASLLWQTSIAYTYGDFFLKCTPNQAGDNGIAAGCGYLYTSDGLALDQRDLSTGAIINSITIPGGNNTPGSINSGIAVDLECGNVYVGSNAVIYVYDQNLNSIGSFTGLPGVVFDVKYNNGIVSACGDNGSGQAFVVQVNAMPCASGLTVSHTDVTCIAAGTATANASFCTGPYYYSWAPGGKTTQTITGLSAGTYTVSVNPSGTCFTITDTVSIHGGIIVNSSKDSVCSGDSLTLSADSSAGMAFNWSPGGATTAKIHISPVITTTYTVHTHGGPCPADSATFTVKIIPGVTGSVSAVKDTICQGGTATLNVTGSGGIITYKWNTGATSSSINVSPANTTTYTATIYGSCDSTKKPITVTVEPLPTGAFIGKDSLCKGLKDTIQVSGGCSYQWNNGSTSNMYYTGNVNADSSIVVTIKSCFGCTLKDTFKIKSKNPVPVTVNKGTICTKGCVTLTASASGSGLTYNWNTGATTDTITVCPAADTTYTVQVSNGCPSIATTKVTVYPPSIVTLCCDTIIMEGQSATLTANNANTYLWAPPISLNCDSCATVIATPTSTTTYTVTGTDSHGCQDWVVVTVTVETPCFNFTIPNVFTPSNGGILGLDKVFYIKTENLDAWSIIIFDRWGKEMFNTTNPAEYWNGNAESGGSAPAGVYYYIISGTCQNTTYKKDGFVQLIR